VCGEQERLSLFSRKFHALKVRSQRAIQGLIERLYFAPLVFSLIDGNNQDVRRDGKERLLLDAYIHKGDPQCRKPY
jgi:hypothetical protein